MEKKLYKPRVIDRLVEDELEAMGALLLEGAKACGKTTTGEHHAASVLYMDDPMTRRQNLALAETDITRLLVGDTPRLIDEWQTAPQFWDAIRFTVDHRQESGQFILTGSAVPITDRQEGEAVNHTGTGRFGRLTMRPMTLWESGDADGQVSLAALFDGEEPAGESHMNIDELAFLTCRGGWPGALSKKTERAALIQAMEYYESVVASDISRVDHVTRNPESARNLMRAYARHQGTQATIPTLIEDVRLGGGENMSDVTMASYLNALRKIFVIEDTNAWNPNLRSKTAIRTAKTRYFVDSSIAAAALGIGSGDLLNDLNTFGLLFETLCMRDLRVYAEALYGNVYHYRDRSGQECDAVVHLRNGSYGLVEIKLGGDRLIEEGAASLLKLAGKIDTEKMKAPSFLMVLVGVAPYAFRRKDGVFVVPISCLRD